MPEKRGSRTGQTKVQRTATQTTLKGHFQIQSTTCAEKPQDVHPSLEPAPPPSEPPKSTQPIKLFPIFTKFSSARPKPRDTINMDDKEIIDITDSGDIDLSNEPALSSRPLSSCSGLDHATSPPPSPAALNDRGSDTDTSLPHAVHEDTRLQQTGGSTKRSLGDVAPFPSSCSQHVRGLQHCYTYTQAPLKCIIPRARPSLEGTLEFLARWQRAEDGPPTPLNRRYQLLPPDQCEECIRSLSREYAESHPAFARISVYPHKTHLHHTETWTRRFRPRRANEVLGNEHHAIYLRDWLSALELRLQSKEPVAETRRNEPSKRAEPRGVKRPRIIRAVAKKRGNKKRRTDPDDDLDDFVVFSDVDEPADDLAEESEDELAFCQRTFARINRCDAYNTCTVASTMPTAEIDHTTNASEKPAQIQFADHLTNTILITGPPGCGKTAAVYACAEELGWEVFEVYPGIGKRNGANLDHLVGDVGKNHIVQNVRRGGPTKATKLKVKERAGLRGYLGTNKMGQDTGSGKPSREAGTIEQPISVEGECPHEDPLPRDEETVFLKKGNSEPCHAESEGSRPIIGQSLVLLEEVDILFKEDAGFWPAVVEFIQCSQRPVVMTCNDPGLVPIGDLPLQKVLVFEPCGTTVAGRFLQCLSLSEGLLVPHEDLMALYESTQAVDGLDIPDAPLYPRTGPLPLPDLRRCITQLQMLSAGARHGSASEMHQDDEAEGHVRRSGGAISGETRVTAMVCRTERELWRQMKGHAEVLSHVDAEVRKHTGNVRWGEKGKGVGWQEEGRRGDGEEVGYVGLCLSEEREGLEGDELIAEEAIRHSRGGHEENGTGPMEASINGAAREEARGFGARVEYQSRMVYALQDILCGGAPKVPQRSVFLDYIPWVRFMVATEDEEEARAQTGRVRGGRCTRNSLRTLHERTMAVGEGQRAALRTSRLGEAWQARELM